MIYSIVICCWKSRHGTPYVVMLHFFPQCHQAFSFSVQFTFKPSSHILGVTTGGWGSKPGFTFSDVIVTSPYQRSTSELLCHSCGDDDPRNVVVVVVAGEYCVSTRHDCYGWCRLPFSAGPYIGNRIKGIVTYAHIGALSRFGYTVFHASLPFYSTMPACVLRGNNHKRCHLCRGNSCRQDP